MSVADAAARLSVSESRILQLLKTRCPSAEDATFELESPEGVPTGTRRVSERTVTIASITDYEVRHPLPARGRRRSRHAAATSGNQRLTPSGSEVEFHSRPEQASIQTLRIEIENQLRKNFDLATALEDHRREAVELVRHLRHKIVDLESDLELQINSAVTLTGRVDNLESAVTAFGDVFTQELGPQSPADADDPE